MDKHFKTLINDIKDQMKCPITGGYFVDPVVTVDGHTYERAAIERWFRRKNTSPITNKPLASKRIVPSLYTRQTVTRMINADVIDKASAGTWHILTGWAKYRGILPGGEAAAKTHFKHAATFGHKDATILLDAFDLRDRAMAGHVDIVDIFDYNRPRDYCRRLPTSSHYFVTTASASEVLNLVDSDDVEDFFAEAQPQASQSPRRPTIVQHMGARSTSSSNSPVRTRQHLRFTDDDDDDDNAH